MIVIDNFAELQENQDQLVETQLMPLMRASRGVGITFVVAANIPHSIPSKVYNLFGERVTFRQSDTDRYMDIVGRGAVEFGDIPGRGYVRRDQRPLLFQVAQPLGVLDKDGQHLRPAAEEIREMARTMRAVLDARGSVGWQPERIDTLPVTDSMINYTRTLGAVNRPIGYFSCFISYSSHDDAFAKRLYADLQAAGVRCWFAPHNLQIGEQILSGIDQGIMLHDKLLLILSESSVMSPWIEQEVNMALARERTERRHVLFPIRIDNSVSVHTAGWPALVWNERHVGDFRQWKEYDAYHAAFGRLLRDLQAERT